MSIRDAAWMMQAGVLCRRARRSAEQVGVALVYHRVGGEGGDATREILPAVSGTAFARQLRHFRRHYRVVPAGELPKSVPELPAPAAIASGAWPRVLHSSAKSDGTAAVISHHRVKKRVVGKMH